jgi:lipoate-protein ligase A
MSLDNLFIIDTGKADAFFNMALDEVLIGFPSPILRFYSWKTAVSIGKNQSLKEIDINYCKMKNIDIVRRITGGKAVLHDKEITYSLIISEKYLPGSVEKSSMVISNAILSGLHRLGFDLFINKGKTSNEANCFIDPSNNEIVYKHNKKLKKVIGNAQRRTQGKILQHGSILLDVDYEKMMNCFSMKVPKEILKEKIIGLNQIKMEYTQDLKKAISIGFKEVFDCEITNTILNPRYLNKAKEVSKNYHMT